MKKREIKDLLKKDKEIRRTLAKAKTTIKTILYECEDMNKVSKALMNVLNVKPVVREIGGEKYLVAEAVGYEYVYRIFNHFRMRKVLATLRKYLYKYLDRDRGVITIYLHKQAAYAGVLSLVDPGESPLGDIIVTIETQDPDNVIKWLTRF